MGLPEFEWKADYGAGIIWGLASLLLTFLLSPFDLFDDDLSPFYVYAAGDDTRWASVAAWGICSHFKETTTCVNTDDTNATATITALLAPDNSTANLALVQRALDPQPNFSPLLLCFAAITLLIAAFRLSFLVIWSIVTGKPNRFDCPQCNRLRMCWMFLAAFGNVSAVIHALIQVSVWIKLCGDDTFRYRLGVANSYVLVCVVLLWRGGPMLLLPNIIWNWRERYWKRGLSSNRAGLGIIW